jgi:hypothetical protein
MLKGISTVRIMADLARLSPPLTFADAPVFRIEPPVGFEVLTRALPR